MNPSSKHYQRTYVGGQRSYIPKTRVRGEYKSNIAAHSPSQILGYSKDRASPLSRAPASVERVSQGVQKRVLISGPTGHTRRSNTYKNLSASSYLPDYEADFLKDRRLLKNSYRNRMRKIINIADAKTREVTNLIANSRNAIMKEVRDNADLQEKLFEEHIKIAEEALVSLVEDCLESAGDQLGIVNLSNSVLGNDAVRSANNTHPDVIPSINSQAN